LTDSTVGCCFGANNCLACSSGGALFFEKISGNNGLSLLVDVTGAETGRRFGVTGDVVAGGDFVFVGLGRGDISFAETVLGGVVSRETAFAGDDKLVDGRGDILLSGTCCECDWLLVMNTVSAGSTGGSFAGTTPSFFRLDLSLLIFLFISKQSFTLNLLANAISAAFKPTVSSSSAASNGPCRS
jgi:hypothetical protein